MSESIIQCCFRISCEICVDCGHYCHGDRCVTKELLICRKNDVLMLFPGLCLAFVTGGLQSRVLARECILVTLVFSQCLCSQELMNRHGTTSEPLLPHLLLGKINSLGGYLYLSVMWPSCDHHVTIMWLSCDGLASIVFSFLLLALFPAYHRKLVCERVGNQANKCMCVYAPEALQY